MRARSLQKELGYQDWRNLHDVIKKAIEYSRCDPSIIIKKRKSKAKIGSGAYRDVVDYELNANGVDLIKKFSSASKPIAGYRYRSETSVVHMIAKYYSSRGVFCSFQFRLDKFIYDCKIGSSILFEFDESHHDNKTQIIIDNEKTIAAVRNGYKIFRAKVEDDIIDIIISLNSILFIC
jgi:hypothetical protein